MKKWVWVTLKILNAAVLPVGAALLIVLFKLWANYWFWIFAILAIGLALLLDRIPNRMRWIKVTLFLPLPLAGLIYAKLHQNLFLLADTCILVVVMDLISLHKKRGRFKFNL